MKLIFLLIFGIIPLTFEDEYYKYKLYGYLKRNTLLKLYYSGYCFYLKPSEFYDVDNVEINVTLYSGHFTENIITYGQNDECFPEGSNIHIPLNQTYTSYSPGRYIGSNNYEKYTYIFKIPKLAGNYWYISVPTFSGSYVDVIVNYKQFEYSKSSSNSYTNDFSLVTIVGAVSAVIILIIIIAIICCCVRRSRRVKNQLNYNSPAMKPIVPSTNIIIPSAKAVTPSVDTYAAPIVHYPSNVPLITTSYDSSVTYEPMAPPVYIPPNPY